jgi:aspartyl-tRNA(Asn)/glutamyl-tRNA(Gln) amidotransferase subunit C
MISKEQVEHVAKLARIELTEKEKEKFSLELSSILNYIDKLNMADVSRIEGISQITGLKNVYRQDEVKTGDPGIKEKILQNAPSRKGDYFKVPKILE